jgi:hypothetical protein
MLPTHPPPGWIDGSKTPKLIPDKDAFRLVFLWLQPPLASNSQATARQAMRLKKVGLSDADKAVAQQVLMQFAFDYQQWVLARTLPNAAQQSDALVQQTRDAFAQRLSADGNAKLAAFVQASKSHMAVKP